MRDSAHLIIFFVYANNEVLVRLPAAAPTRALRGRTGLFVLLVWVCAGALAPCARAQESGDIITDRPDETETPISVMPGYVQFEMGWSYVEADVDGSERRTHQVPETIVRIGVVRGLEARLGFAGWRHRQVTSSTGTETRSGAGPLRLGAKYQFNRGQGMTPTVGLLGALILPTAAEGLGPERVDPTFRVAVAHEASSVVVIGYNLGLRWLSVEALTGETSTQVEGVYTLAFGFALTERLGAFAEAFGALALSEDAVSVASLNTGLTFLARRNLQFDAKVGIGLHQEADAWFVGAGFAWRVPR